MQTVRSILVYLETVQLHDVALRRAMAIAKSTQANLHLLVCDRAHDQSLALNFLQEQLRGEGFSVTAEQAWRGNLHDTIIYVQQVFGCELLVKHHLPESPLRRALLTPLDWKLLRDCPSAVLMVKTERPWTGGAVLAAVDVDNSDSEHRSLHTLIVDHGYDLARLAGGALHVIAAHPGPMVAPPGLELPPDDAVEARYRQQCQRFQAEFCIDDRHLHVMQGAADVLIPDMARQLDAVVTVIGTVARRGIPGALIGNTAEVVLDQLECDVLVLKTHEIIDHLSEMAPD